MTGPYRAEIEAAAATHGLVPELVAALVEKESSNDADAWNPEPRYRYLWNVRTGRPFRPVTVVELASKFPPFDFKAMAGDDDQEWWAQQASWGLGQVMGAVAREHGFKGKYLTALCSDPVLNLDYTCRHLAGHMRWARSAYTGLSSSGHRAITRAALASYNGGRVGNSPVSGALRNGDYADDVLRRYERIRKP